MRQTLLKLELAVLVLVVASIARAVPPPLPDLSTFPNSLGVNIHFTDPKPGEMEQIYAAGFRWVRMDFSWAGIEHAKGEYDFSAYDRLIASLDQYHMHAIFILDYGNRHYDKGLSPYTDDGRAAFAKWAAASVHHFKGHGVFWEMWNEPNGSFWKPARNVDDYIKLALVVGKAIEEAEPGEIYIGPATSTIDMPFLEACFKAGCLQSWSAVSVHPYRQTDPETVADEYRKLRKLIAQYAPKGRQIPIISGEWGYSSAWKDFDEERQAKYLPREMLTNIANDVPLSIWYDWHEDGKDPKEPEHHFGIVKPDGVNKEGELYEPKKAYVVSQRLSKVLDGARFNKRLIIGDRNIRGGKDDYVLLFEDRAGGPILLCWTTLPKHDVVLPIRSGAMVESVFGGASRDLPANSEGLHFNIDDSPAYIRPKGNEPLLQIGLTWTRVPLDVISAGAVVARVETTVRNPLKRPVTIVDDNDFNLKQVLDTGGSCPVVGRQWVCRSAINLPLETVLTVEDVGWLVQHTELTSTNPLRAIFLPPDGANQSVILENPTGDGFVGVASIMLPKLRLDFPVESKAGEKTKTIQFTLPKGSSESPPVGLNLSSPPGSLALYALGDARYVALPARHDTLNIIADGDAKVKSDLGFSSNDPPDGPVAPNRTSLKISYRFDQGWKFLRVAPKTSLSVEGAPSAIGLWVHGDASGNIARMRFTDSTGQTFQPDGGRITWKGWRYIEFPMTGRDTAHFGGANDGTVHYPVKIDSLFLLDSANRQPTGGEIYLSTPTVIYNQPK